MEERILIVDDDITFALMLRTWLSPCCNGWRERVSRRR